MSRRCTYVACLAAAVLFAPMMMEKAVGIIGIILCLFLDTSQ